MMMALRQLSRRLLLSAATPVFASLSALPDVIAVPAFHVTLPLVFNGIFGRRCMFPIRYRTNPMHLRLMLNAARYPGGGDVEHHRQRRVRAATASVTPNPPNDASRGSLPLGAFSINCITEETGAFLLIDRGLTAARQ